MKNISIEKIDSIKMTKIIFDDVSKKISKTMKNNNDEDKNIIVNLAIESKGGPSRKKEHNFIDNINLSLNFKKDDNVISTVSICYQIILETNNIMKESDDDQKKYMFDKSMEILEPYFRETLSSLSHKTQMSLPELPFKFWRNNK